MDAAVQDAALKHFASVGAPKDSGDYQLCYLCPTLVWCDFVCHIEKLEEFCQPVSKFVRQAGLQNDSQGAVEVPAVTTALCSHQSGQSHQALPPIHLFALTIPVF